MAENLPDTNVGNIEYISKQDAVYSIIANADDLEQNGCIPYAQGARAMAIVVERMPPADVVQVVRCRECKFFRHIYAYDRDICESAQGCVRPLPDGFCSYGERKGE